MKFLLKHHIKFDKKDGLVKVYTGTYNLINIANNINIPKTVIEKFDGNHLITEGYIFTVNDFYWLKLLYEQDLEHKRTEFFSLDPLIQVIKILKYIFKRNTDAKRVSKHHSSLNAYDDKTTFLKLALEISRTIKYPFFKHGFQEDPLNSYHDIIYYFEIKDIGQVSFHSNILFLEVPPYSGEWIGSRNIKYPFDLRQIKKLIAKS